MIMLALSKVMDFHESVESRVLQGSQWQLARS
jgi:hypothetical protein